MTKTILFSCVVSICFLVQGQIKETEIGQWQEHVPYNKANSVAAAGDIIYCGSSAGFIAFNTQSGEIKRYSTITGLSDIGVTLLKYNNATKSLLVTYKNGNLDIIKGNKIINVASIKNATIIGDKTVYNIRIEGVLAYLSTGFGIVVVDMNRAEIKETYLIGNESKPLLVYDVYLNAESNTIYAATKSGVRFADLEDNLADYNVWSLMTTLPDPNGTYNHIDFFQGKLFLNHRTAVADSDVVYTVENNIASVFTPALGSVTNDFQVEKDRIIITKLYNILIYDEQLTNYGILYIYEEGFGMNPRMAIYYRDHYWIADNFSGLAKFSTVGVYQTIAPDGPNTLSINDIDVKKGVLWTSSGLLDAGYRTAINIPEFNSLVNNSWEGDISQFNEVKLDSLYGYVQIAINPYNTDQVFSSSWDNGLLEILNGKVNRVFNNSTRTQYNHTLTSIQGTGFIRSGGMAFDDNQNLWVTCSETPFALNVMESDESWTRFDLGNFVDGNTIVGEVIIDKNTGYKWIILNRASKALEFNRIVVYDDNGTPSAPIDDRYTVLMSTEGNGNIPGTTVNTIVQDKGGAMWIGTDLGPAVFYNPSNVFNDQIEAQRIFVQQDGQTQILLETENVMSITVDGADRKWFGTANSGVYLMSSDATSEVSHFTKENSPLFTDEVNEVVVDGENGEVYFCTSEGLISYKGTATDGDKSFGNVQVFPNPVDQNYSGPIAIKGLTENANVKITDANGVLIYETFANGGQATWDGYSLNGNRAKNGVYLIFATDNTGESQEVTKLLFLNH